MDTGTFRRGMGQFLTGVTVVAALDCEVDAVHGMTANAFMSVSLEPPLVLVSIGGATRMHRILERSVSFGVSILREGQEPVALQLAGNVKHSKALEFAELDSGPVLADCLASVCADIASTTRVGDHTLFIGTATQINLRAPRARPLAYHRGRFVAVGAPTGDWPLDIADAWAGSLRSGWG